VAIYTMCTFLLVPRLLQVSRICLLSSFDLVVRRRSLCCNYF
jgi:hypothetical protein